VSQRRSVWQTALGAAAALLPEDAFTALAGIAREVRSRSTAEVVAVTGSTAKTSTKDILAALCRPHARTVAAEGSQNNEVGLPLTLCKLEPDTEVAVVEMGMRGLGQIAELCEIARPDVGIVTAIGPVHLELLGSIERVAQAKAELIEALPPGGTAVVPANQHYLEPYPWMLPLEVLQDLLKPVTLALRLFGNIFAGSIMLALIAGLAGLTLGPLPVGSFLTIVFNIVWKLFDTMFLGGLQAFIFALLTVLYFGMAGAGHDEHDSEHEPETTDQEPAAAH